MRFIRTIILLIIVTSTSFSQEYLENTAMVRFKSFHFDYTELNRILEAENATIVRRMLPLASSVRFNAEEMYFVSKSKRLNDIFEAEEPLLRTYIIVYDRATDPVKFCYYLKKKYSEVEIAEPYYLQKIQAYTPNDPQIFGQEDMFNLIKAKEAWEIYKGDSDITIGISDNGVQQSHEDLKDNIAINTNEIQGNGIDDDENGYIDDYDGFNLDGRIEGEDWWNTYNDDNHGTLVSGIAGADFDNSIGIAGIGGKSKIFPIKIGSINVPGNFTAYGYESILYAGVRKFKVLNCSWGVDKNYSSLEQSVIDYAVANDVAIVSASGNLEGGAERITKFFPPGYKGILGVGEVTTFDNITPTSSLGTHCQIMAPGQGNFSTDIDRGSGNPYITVSTGTSFASPVVAGAVALARGKHPELDATQSLQFVRQCTDDISKDLSFFKQIVPGRLNLLKVVSTDPMSIPGIVIEDIQYLDENGEERERFFEGDTVKLNLKIINVLGNASQLDFKMTRVYPDPGFSEILTILDSTENGIDILNGESKNLSEFSYKINSNNVDRVIFRLDISRQNGYKDFILFDIFPVSTITTFENDSIKFSIGDKGNFGFGEGSPFSLLQGVGFIDKGYGDDLFESGIYISENDEKVITSFTGKSSNFSPVKPYFNPKDNGIIVTSDPLEPNFKVKVEQTIELPKSKPWVRIKIDIQDSSALGSQYGVGYEFDWDVGLEDEYEFNYTDFMEESKPEKIAFEKYAAVFTGNKHISQVFGAAMYSKESDAIAQATGLNANEGLNTTKLINSLASGKVNITKDTSDVLDFVGMRFSNNFDPYETKTCYLCVAGAADTNLLSSYLKDCATDNLNSVEEEKNIYIGLNSIDNTFDINLVDYVNAEIITLSGATVFETTERQFDLNGLGQGIYFVKIDLKDRFIIKKISIIR